MDRFVVISGCSGGGKSALIEEMNRRGHAVVEEPGRRIVIEQQRSGGQAVPWIDLAAFGEQAVEMAIEDRAKALHLPGLVFFDRGLIDAAAALEHATRKPALSQIASERYNRRVFLAPPWPEIYRNDAQRKHGLAEAIAEYERLLDAYDALSYTIEILPKIGVSQRADFVLARLAEG